MPNFRSTASFLALAAALPVASVSAQEADTPITAYDEEIVVIAERIRGQVDTDQPPIIELNEEEIASYGADSLADLVAQLAPQTGSGRGRGVRPVFLINGQRVSGFREFRRYPPEAIRKVEVLPEEVAQKFGYPADQRVINFILKDNFASREIEAEYGGPTSGGSASGEVEGSLLTIDGPRRISVAAEFNTTSMLTEDERDIIQTDSSTPDVATDPDPAAYRSLISDSESVELEATLNSGFGEGGLGGSFSLNGNFTSAYTRSLSGLDTVLLSDGTDSALRTLDTDPLQRLNHATTYSIGSSINKRIGDWQSSLTLDGVRTETKTWIDQRRDASALVAAAAAGTLAIDGPLPAVPAAGQDIANNVTNAFESKATFIGAPLVLPAGEVSVTFNTEFDWKRIESDDTRTTVETSLTRRRLGAGANVQIPIAERGAAWGAIGDLSLNLQANLEDLSDFGLLGQYSTGLTWSPAERLTLQGNYIYREVAPSLTNLGSPQVQTFNVPVYDFTNGETVLATITSGGNPNLLAETQRDIKLSASYDLDLFDRANIIVEYFRNRSSNVTESFPLLTPAVEAAFPGRATRDANGTLVALDRTPVTFAKRNSERIRYGFNIFGRVGKPQPQGGEQGGGARGGPPAAVAPGGAAGRSGGTSDPGRFAAIREKFCATPEGETPDISALPEPMQGRLRGPDGQVDPERLARMRARMCSADGGPQGGPDPERFAAIRKALCDVPEGQEPDLSALPEPMLERLRGPDGQIDPNRLAQLRERLCAMPAPQGQQARGGNRGGGGGPRFGRGGNGQGRWNLSLYHSVELKNEALVGANGPLFDLLGGDALGSGGVARHKFELEGGVFYKGVGMRLSGNYAGKTRINGTGLPGSSDLFFGDLVTFDMRMFVNLEEQSWLTGDNPGFFKGMRMSIRANNLFNARQRVVDETGAVPLSYQPGLVDPVGRYIEIDFRKMF